MITKEQKEFDDWIASRIPHCETEKMLEILDLTMDDLPNVVMAWQCSDDGGITVRCKIPFNDAWEVRERLLTHELYMCASANGEDGRYMEFNFYHPSVIKSKEDSL